MDLAIKEFLLGSKVNRWYGVEWDITNTSPSCTRIASSPVDMALHATLPVQNAMRTCLLLDNGTVNYYLNPTDWTKKADGSSSDLSGSDGQVMVEIPEHYLKFEQSDNTRRAKLSLNSFSGAIKVPQMYVSAFEATVQRSVNKLASVVNMNADYRGGNNASAWDASHTVAFQDGTPAAANPAAGNTITFNTTVFTFVNALTDPAVAGEVLIGTTAAETMANFVSVFNGILSDYTAVPAGTPNHTCSIRSNIMAQGTIAKSGDNIVTTSLTRSLLGRPATAISRTTFRTYARARDAGSKWNLYTYDAHKALTWLFVIEYATRNSQLAVNNALTSEGYRQGGLGAGVTTAISTEWNNFNGYYCFVPCGASNSLGNGSGEVSYSALNFGGAGVTRIFPVNRYRGIEHPFGHIWKFTDGANVKIQSVAAGGESQLWVAENPADFNDANYTNYENRGLLARTEEYVRNILFGPKGEILPETLQSSSTQFWCDYWYTSLPASGESLRTLIWGGSAIFGAYAGLAIAHSTYTPAHTYANLGSRLCYLP